MNEELTNDEVEIDLVDLGYVLLDKWRYLLISLIAGAVLLGAYSFFFIAPTYESTAKLYVVSASDDSVVNLSDLNLGTSEYSFRELSFCYYRFPAAWQCSRWSTYRFSVRRRSSGCTCRYYTAYSDQAVSL